MGGEVAPDEPLAAQGLDSLAGMELRQKLQVPNLLQLLPLLLLLLLLLPAAAAVCSCCRAYPDVGITTHVLGRCGARFGLTSWMITHCRRSRGWR